MSKPKVIAFYLPQYHPTPDNDKWWGKGFTEWTNVGKAKPLFKGHYQPKVPADLGYYDLRLPEVRDAQAELAKEAGIYGFCYYHYWFAGKEELELPFNEVLKLGKPDFPFMLCWANESWHKKFWNKDGVGSSKEMLIEQTYPGEEDHIAHFYRLLPAFKDPRYIKIEGKPAFMIYKPLEFPDLKKFIDLWNDLAIKEGVNGIYFIAHLISDLNEEIYNFFIDEGFEAINTNANLQAWTRYYLKRNRFINKFKSLINRISQKPLTLDFKNFIYNLYTEFDKRENIIPTIIPNWDHTPRSGTNGRVLINSSPKVFAMQLEIIKEIIRGKKDPVIFLKSWNEWGEGNYVEPDLKFGKGFLESIRIFTVN